MVGSLNDELTLEYHGCFDSCDILSQIVPPSISVKCCQKDNCNLPPTTTATTKTTMSPINPNKLM